MMNLIYSINPKILFALSMTIVILIAHLLG
jgi:hypothetical protein